MREWNNLLWPETPFGFDKRPWARKVQLVAALAVQWADDGERAVPLAVGMVGLSVHRTQTRTVHPATFNFGYRAAVMDEVDQPAAMAALVDGYLVQARRHAVAVAAHSFADDAPALQKTATGRLPGVTSVAQAWPLRDQRGRGLAMLVDTAADIELPAANLHQAAARHGLTVPEGRGGLLAPAEPQRLYDELFAEPRPQPKDREALVQTLALSAVHQAVTVGLLAAEHLCRISWAIPFSVHHAVKAVTWDAFPEALTGPAGALSGH